MFGLQQFVVFVVLVVLVSGSLWWVLFGGIQIGRAYINPGTSSDVRCDGQFVRVNIEKQQVQCAVRTLAASSGRSRRAR